MQTIVEKTQDIKLKIDHQGTPQKPGMNWGFPEMKVNECLMFGKYRVSFYVKDTWQQLLIQIECKQQ